MQHDSAKKHIPTYYIAGTSTRTPWHSLVTRLSVLAAKTRSSLPQHLNIHNKKDEEPSHTHTHTHRQFDDNDFSNTPPPINQNSNTKKKTKGDHSSEIVNNVVVYEDNEHERGSRTNLQEQLWSDAGGSANEQLRALAASSIGRQHERARETLTAT